MSRSLHGITVVHFEARRAAEMDSLIARHGGIPQSTPALSEVPIAPTAEDLASINALATGAFALVVLLTGTATKRLLDEASRIHRLDDVIAGLRRTIIVARGPKPVHVLRSHGLVPTHVAPEPHTTVELLATLDTLAVTGLRTLVLTAGDVFQEPTTTLRSRGAHPVELSLYEWALSAPDAARIDATIQEIFAGRVGAVLFTTQVQVRHVFDVAARRGVSEELARALREHVLIGAVGPTVAQALAQRGVCPHVVPEHPKMGHLVVALADRGGSS